MATLGGETYATDCTFHGNRHRAASLTRVARAFWVIPVLLGGFVQGEVLPLDAINPKGHSRDVTAVAFTPDGKTLVSAGADGLAKIWDVANGSVRADLAGHQHDVLCLAISPDGKTVATGGEDMTIRLWATSDGASLGVLSGHSGGVAALAFARDGKMLASGSLDATVRLWDISSHGVSRMLEGHVAAVQGVAYAPDGKSLATASRDGKIKLWDVVSGKELRDLGMHQGGWAWCVAFSPNGKTVVSGGFDKKVKFWRLDQPEPQPKQKAQPGQMAQQQAAPEVQVEGDVLALAFSRDGATLAVAPSDTNAKRPVPGSIEILNVANRQIVARVKGHLGAVRALAYSPDGKTLASGAKDRSIRLWDVKAGTTLRDTWLGPWPPGPVNDRIMTNLDSVEALAISPDGKTIVTSIGDPIVTYWQVSTHDVQKRLRDPSGPVRASQSVRMARR